ncbi:hypothetical protein AUC70_11890 [Methyloceanibacter stevinii]|uniref:Uncharacterized protein n=1 Tax=Methyloceanibacter stevinii TaxID=1774970 RepID=A0A1E3VJ59_9HYPH|nr:hypothetical protein [Methyloceanibacter stevinii]ODR93557.1 hypothetical protein AUC70_11890 [Methyloceanibacter stevinii]
MRKLVVTVALIVAASALVFWIDHGRRAEADRQARCADYELRLAAFEHGQVTGDYDAKGESRSGLEFRVSRCRQAANPGP